MKVSRPLYAAQVLGGHVSCKKRALIQGGIFVTSGGEAAFPATQINAVAAQWHRGKGKGECLGFAIHPHKPV